MLSDNIIKTKIDDKIYISYKKINSKTILVKYNIKNINIICPEQIFSFIAKIVEVPILIITLIISLQITIYLMDMEHSCTL